MSNTMATAFEYSTTVLEHFRRPRHSGELGGDPHTICTGIAGTVKSGAQVCIQLRFSDEFIRGVGWQVYGCPSTIAAASWLAEHIHGRSVAEASALTALEISDALQIAPERRDRAMIVEDAFRAALSATPEACGNL